MKNNRFSMLCVAGIVVGTVCATAEAKLPHDQTIRYKIREIPSDAQSDVIFTITLKLRAYQLDGDSVGWQINEIRFVRMSDKAEWSEAYGLALKPSLWWVDHADHRAPQLAEFAMPPFLGGTADAASKSEPDLVYDFEGLPSSAASVGLFEDNVGSLDVVLWVAGAVEPEVDDDDEPVEVDNGGDPS